jgi:hypothetical protein
MKWFSIGDDNFSAKEISIQFSIDTANNTFGYAKMVNTGCQTIDITIVMENNQKNNSYFFNLYNQRSGCVSNYKFDINSYQFTANGCIIRSISTDPNTNTLTMDITSDYSKVIPLDERRDQIIEQILDETSKTKNDIN